ncbi:MAG: DUF3052 domain-containing protein [Actinomycetaceae bacterium]|nr:DUF3052 domain-containing protein [Actinomycetaceae bacterium]
MDTNPVVESLGFSGDMVVQEFGWDEDVDEVVREAIETACGQQMEYEDFQGVADGAIIWWRSDDGDVDALSDLMLDAMRNLDDGGVMWVLSPKASLPDHVPPRDIEEAAKAVGQHPTTSEVVSPNWSGIRIVSRGR